jgi:hypothetical protein
MLARDFFTFLKLFLNGRKGTIVPGAAVFVPFYRIAEALPRKNFIIFWTLFR